MGEDPVVAGLAFSRGLGVDGVIITASTKSSDPVTQAARMSRRRGRIILVGVTGLELNRSDFYEKELSFQVSCSYGPGRYDPAYEDKGQDYPIGFVRWTEQRNFSAVLDLMAVGRLDVADLITHRIAFTEAPNAYKTLSTDRTALGIILVYDYPIEPRHALTIGLSSGGAPAAAGKAVLGVVGAGNYASRMLLPAFRAAGARMHAIASAGGTSGVVHGRRNGFSEATSDTASLIGNPQINTVVIATRHDSHAKLTIDALTACKHVFVEKPLALNLEELSRIEAAHLNGGRVLMVGFNRRFSPLVQSMKRHIDRVTEPKVVVMIMNSGEIPKSHWTQDAETGGGRIIGEACHHIDLMRYLVGSPIVSVQARRMGDSPAVRISEDKAAIILGFADGSLGTIHYLANGGPAFPKERIEVFAAGRTLQLENFTKLRSYNWPGVKTTSLWRQNKGQLECAAAFLRAVEEGGPPPIPIDELFEVARVTIEAAQLIRGQTLSLPKAATT